MGTVKIGQRVGQVANKYKVRKHFDIAIGTDNHAAITMTPVSEIGTFAPWRRPSEMVGYAGVNQTHCSGG
jgi:hypothetical protein